MDIEKLKRRLNRLEEQRDKLQKEHGGNEHIHTYWGGYHLGYLKGKICEIEDILDELGDMNSDKKCLECDSKNRERRGDSIYCECGYLIEIIL